MGGRLKIWGGVSGNLTRRLGETKGEKRRDSWGFGWHGYLVARLKLGLSLWEERVHRTMGGWWEAITRLMEGEPGH